MSTSNILMNIDFSFSGHKALKGIASARKGFKNLEESMAAVKNMDNSFKFGKTTAGVQHVTDLLGTQQEAFRNSLQNMQNADVDSFVDVHTKMWQDIFENNVRGIRALNNAKDEVATSIALMKTEDLQKKSKEVSEGIEGLFTKFGLTMEAPSAAIQMASDSIASFSEKSLANFGETVSKMGQLQENMNPRQLARSMELMKEMDAAFVNLEERRKAQAWTEEQYYKESAKLAQQYGKQIDHLSYKVEFMNERWANAKRSVQGLFSGTSASFLSTIAAASVIDDAVSAQRQTAQTIHQLSMVNDRIAEGNNSVRAMRQTTMEVNASIRDVAGATQISMTRASEAMNSLAAARVPGTIEDLENLTTTSVRMQQAFGVSEGQAADLFRTLSLTGNLSPDAIDGVAESLADVQAVWGMTNEEAQEASAQVGRVINRMTAMGANSIKNANVVAREVGRMVTAFNRAGMSAQEASQMMDRFMDPSKIEDNVLLWHNMGMSVSDGLSMMTGDAAAMEGMTENLMKAAHDLRNEYGQNPLALQAMSEAHGLTIQDVNRLANEFEREQEILSDPAAMRAREQQATLENQANQARQNAADALQRLAAIGNVLLQTFIMPFLDLITPMIHGLANLATWFNESALGSSKLGEFIRGAAGAVLLFAIILKTNLLRLMSPVGSLSGAFGTMFSTISAGSKSAIKGLGSFVSFAVSKLGKGGPVATALGGIGEKMRGIGGGRSRGGQSGARGVQRMQQQGPSSPVGGQDKGPSKFMEGLRKIPAKQLMQVGAAMLMVAGAVALLAVSFKILVDVVQEASLGELAAGFGLLVVILGLVAAMAKILAAVSKTASPQIAMLGVSLLLVGAAVALMVGSMALLFEALEGLGSEQIWGGIAALGVALVGLIAILIVMGSIGPAMAPGILMMGVALLTVAASFTLFGLAAIMAGKGLQLISEAINNIGENFKENAATMASAIFTLIPAIAALGAVALVASVGIVPLAAGFVVLALGILLVGGAMSLVNEGFSSFASLIASMGENIFAIVGGFAALAAGMVLIGSAAAAFGIPLLIAGVAFTALGAAFALIGPSINGVIEAFSSLSEISSILIPTALQFSAAIVIMTAGVASLALLAPIAVAALTGLAIVTPVLLILGAAMRGVSNSFMRMGTGVQLFAQNIDQAVNGVKNLKSELSGVRGMSRDFIRELSSINTALESFTGTAAASIDVQQQISASIDNSSETDEVVSKMNDVIDNLNSIKQNTGKTTEELEKLNRFFRRNRQAFNPANDVGMA